MAKLYTEEQVVSMLARDREILSARVDLVYRNACFKADNLGEHALLDGEDQETASGDADETFNHELLQGLSIGIEK